MTVPLRTLPTYTACVQLGVQCYMCVSYPAYISYGVSAHREESAMVIHSAGLRSNVVDVTTLLRAFCFLSFAISLPPPPPPPFDVISWCTAWAAPFSAVCGRSRARRRRREVARYLFTLPWINLSKIGVVCTLEWKPPLPMTSFFFLPPPPLP